MPDRLQHTERYREFKNLNYSHWILAIVPVYFSIYNFIKSDDISVKYGDVTMFKMTALRHLEFSEF